MVFQGFFYGRDLDCSSDINNTCYGAVRSADALYGTSTARNVWTGEIETSNNYGESVGTIEHSFGANLPNFSYHNPHVAGKDGSNANRYSSLLVREVSADSDSDGLSDMIDECPTDPTNTCNQIIDSDGDGIEDYYDECPSDPTNQCNVVVYPDPDPISVPEPSIIALMFTGLFGLGVVRRKKKLGSS